MDGAFPVSTARVSQVPGTAGQRASRDSSNLPLPFFLAGYDAATRSGMSGNTLGGVERNYSFSTRSPHSGGATWSAGQLPRPVAHERIANYNRAFVAPRCPEKPGDHVLTHGSIIIERPDFTTLSAGRKQHVWMMRVLWWHGVPLKILRHDPDAYRKLFMQKAPGIPHAAHHAAGSPLQRIPMNALSGCCTALLESQSLSRPCRRKTFKGASAVMTPAMDLEGGRSMDWFFRTITLRSTECPPYRME